jgi:hypothetical protein
LLDGKFVFALGTPLGFGVRFPGTLRPISGHVIM